jgi:hypothetical protein
MQYCCGNASTRTHLSKRRRPNPGMPVIASPFAAGYIANSGLHEYRFLCVALCGAHPALMPSSSDSALKPDRILAAIIGTP